MRITHPIATTLCIAALAAGCGSDSPTGPDPDPEPQTTTLRLNFSFIQVVDDCDGIEGDGDFQFQVMAGEPGSLTTVYNQSISLPPGGQTPSLGRRSFTVDASHGAEVKVQFLAWEWDRDIVGNVYADERMDEAFAGASHVHTLNGNWSRLGTSILDVGIPGCLVELYYGATVE